MAFPKPWIVAYAVNLWFGFGLRGSGLMIYRLLGYRWTITDCSELQHSLCSPAVQLEAPHNTDKGPVPHNNRTMNVHDVCRFLRWNNA